MERFIRKSGLISGSGLRSLIQKMVLITLIGVLVSCASNKSYRPLTDTEATMFMVVEPIKITFIADNGLGSSIMTETIKQHAYIRLKEEAYNKYQSNADVRNIIVIYSQITRTQTGLLSYEWVAHGDIILPRNMAAAGLEESLARAAEQIMASLEPDSNIAIVYVSSDDDDVTGFIANELEYIMVNNAFTIIERNHLDKIREEQNLQLSGEVDDITAVSIGKVVGANIIITGSVTGIDSTRRLRLRALSVETAQVLAATSERL